MSIDAAIDGIAFLKSKLFNGIFRDRLECLDIAISTLSEKQKRLRDAAKMTNADKIRSMSNEELVALIQTPFCDKRTNEECKISYCGCCDVCIMDWLNSDTTGGDDYGEER